MPETPAKRSATTGGLRAATPGLRAGFARWLLTFDTDSQKVGP